MDPGRTSLASVAASLLMRSGSTLRPSSFAPFALPVPLPAARRLPPAPPALPYFHLLIRRDRSSTEVRARVDCATPRAHEVLASGRLLARLHAGAAWRRRARGAARRPRHYAVRPSRLDGRAGTAAWDRAR